MELIKHSLYLTGNETEEEVRAKCEEIYNTMKQISEVQFDPQDNYLGELDDEEMENPFGDGYFEPSAEESEIDIDESAIPDGVINSLLGLDDDNLTVVERRTKLESFIEGMNIPRAIYDDHYILLDTHFGIYKVENVGMNKLLPSVVQIADRRDDNDFLIQNDTYKEILNLPREMFDSHNWAGGHFTFEEIIENIPKPRIIFNGCGYVLNDGQIYRIINVGCERPMLKIEKFKFTFTEIDEILLALLTEMLKEQ